VPLLDLAKKKILRIGDEIEEEVDGDLVRFRLRDEVLAVLETGGELALCLGDAPELRRPIPDRTALEAAVDDVVRRYFSLVRHARPARSERPCRKRVKRRRRPANAIGAHCSSSPACSSPPRSWRASTRVRSRAATRPRTPRSGST
jgi:hypothetical protein